jgi:hypothetical protein
LVGFCGYEKKKAGLFNITNSNFIAPAQTNKKKHICVYLAKRKTKFSDFYFD